MENERLLIQGRSWRWALLTMLGLAMAQAQIPATPSLRPTQLPPLHRDILGAMGTRISQPGKESYTLTGTLEQFTNGQGSTPSAVTVVWQYPGILRLDDATLKISIAFNGNSVFASFGQVSQANLDFVESLAKDVTENFLLERYTGETAQILGRSYNLRDTRATNAITGTCDLLRVNELNGVRGQGSNTLKTYCFDPQTHLLRSVFYQDGAAVIETRYSNWQTVNGESIPTKVERFSGSTPVLLLNVTSVVTSGPLASTFFNLQ